jgi:orotate phosphoribosyltransferase
LVKVFMPGDEQSPYHSRFQRGGRFGTAGYARSMTDDELISRVKDLAVLRGTFTLRSGRTSDYYIDKYRFETQPDVLAAFGERFAKLAGGVDRLAGPELGAVPLATAAALACGKPFVLLRNAKKDYGTANRIEGELNKGDKILLIEDVITSGGQVIEALAALREAGAVVDDVAVAIDREEGGREAIEAQGVTVHAVLRASDVK